MPRTIAPFASGAYRVQVIIGGSKLRLTLDGLVDTGFTGFMLLPISMAIPLGLELDGLSEYTTADGTRQDWPTARATIEFQQQLLERSITLAYTGDEILLGLGFLTAFQQSLIIHRNQVLLMDESDLYASLSGLH